MDADKDTHLPPEKEKDAAPASMDPDKDKFVQAGSEVEKSKGTEQPQPQAPDPVTDQAALPDDDIKKETEDATKTKEEASLPSPPDLKKVSEEMDRFISTLCSAKSQQLDAPPVPDALEHFASLLEAKIAAYDSGETPLKWSQLGEEDASSFLQALDRMCRLMSALAEFNSQSSFHRPINLIGALLDRAMSYLEDEFRAVLEEAPRVSDHHDHSQHQDPKPSKQQPDSSAPAPNHHHDADHSAPLPPDSESLGDTNFPGYPEETVSHLHTIAKALISGGYQTECCQAYIVTRRRLLEDGLHKLGFEKHSIDEVQKMHWETLERTIVSWIKTFKQCTATYLGGERKLSDAVFSGHAAFSRAVFAYLSQGLMIQLLNFAEAVAMSRRSAEKLFKFLDMYEALRDLVPAADGLLPEECGAEIKSEASLTRCRLGETMVSIFCELENSIKADTAKTPVPGGAVHPLTRYIVNYLKYVCEYGETLDQLFREHHKIERADSGARSDYEYGGQDQGGGGSNQTATGQSPFAMQVMKVMHLLDANLESKAKLYKDTSLSSIFMMNNGRYILQKMRGAPEVNGLLDDTWCRKRSSDLRVYHRTYQRETWGRLLQCLNHEGLTVNGKVVKPVLKEKFKSFNAMFDDISKTQSTWVVNDKQLQSELRVSICAVVIPAYRSFMARFSQVLTPGRQTEKYIKYQPEDIETCIENLFDRGAAATGKKKP